MQEHIQLARQAILDASLTLQGYELLARDSSGRFPTNTPGSVSTTIVLINAMAEFGLDHLVGQGPAYINITREFVVGDLPLAAPPGRTVLEVLESIEPDEQVTHGLRNLRSRGFSIALDDYSGFRDGYEDLLELAHVVKVDCYGRTFDEIADIVRYLKKYRVRLLAEKVERHDEFRTYKALGFELFQGFFFAKPDLQQRTTHPVNRINLVQLLRELQDESMTIDRLQEIISRDSLLCLKLIRYLNSAQFGLQRRIDSLHDVVVYLGLATVRNIASLLILCGLDDKPQQLMVTTMMRARMCEELARSMVGANPHTAFTVGLFSTIDAMMDRDLSEVLHDLPFTEDLKKALLSHDGTIGRLLENVLTFETSEQSRAPLNANKVQAAYLSALQWVTAMQGTIVPN